MWLAIDIGILIHVEGAPVMLGADHRNAAMFAARAHGLTIVPYTMPVYGVPAQITKQTTQHRPRSKEY